MRQWAQLFLTVAAAAGVLWAQGARNEIVGTVVGPDKNPVAGTTVLITGLPPEGPAAYSFVPFNLRLNAGPDGSYAAAGLPDGTYQICPANRSNLWLSPCEWVPPTRVVARGGARLSVAPIELIPAQRMLVRLDDDNGLLETHLGKSPRAEYNAVVQTSQNMIRTLRTIARDPKGHTLEVQVPADQAVRLVLSSGFFQFGNGQGQALSRRPGGLTFDPVNVPAGRAGATRQLNMRVTGLNVQ